MDKAHEVLLPGNFFEGKRVLITGNTGFKGGWLTLYLHVLGARIMGMGHRPESLSPHALCQIPGWTGQKYGDIADIRDVRRIVDECDPDIVFHLAGRSLTLSAYDDPLGVFNANALGTANLLEVLRERNQECAVVIVTSDGCYQYNNWVWGYRENDVLEGQDPYSASKSVAEIIAQSYYRTYFKDTSRVRMATCRAGNVIGGGDWSARRIVPDCIRAWSEGKPLAMRQPNAVRPWGYVLDILNGYLQTAVHLWSGRYNGEAFNIGPGMDCEVPVRELVDTLWECWRGSGFDPYTLNGPDLEGFDHNYMRLNGEKAFTLMKWRAQTGLRECLEATARWYTHVLAHPDDSLHFSLGVVRDYILQHGNHE